MALTLVFAPTAGAQPSSEPVFSSDTDMLGNPITYADGAPAELRSSVVTLMPGDSTGWHLHAVPTAGYVLSGELTVEYENGETHAVSAGAGIIEALDTLHNGHNYGDVPLRIVVFNAGSPGVAATQRADPPRPAGFVDLQAEIPGLAIEMRYRGNNNFVGRPIAGYDSDIVYLTREAAAALRTAQEELASEGLGLKVFDGYRPQRAVDDFVQWASDPDDLVMKDDFYPAVDKADLIPGGYIAARSGHSRGSTVDVTLIYIGTGKELDMGSPYDYFDPVSWPSSTAVPPTARANRTKLRDVMLQHGFAPLEEEWWHFTLRDEPYPDTYFDFAVR